MAHEILPLLTLVKGVRFFGRFVIVRDLRDSQIVIAL
jgi:hypothetical protein